MKRLGKNPLVLEKATLKSISIRAHNWSPQAHGFLKRCAHAGNLEACYLLGMIECYCLRSRHPKKSTRKALRYLLRASQGGHEQAMYSLALIFFNGTGVGKSQKNLSIGFSLCLLAAQHGYVDAIREIGHCLQDGYGVPKDVALGRRLLVDANTRELAALLAEQPSLCLAASNHDCLHSDFGYNVPAPEIHPANRFMAEWFKTRQKFGESVRLCANANCSRPETRRFEFRVCSMCTLVGYCSRACQAVHWKTAHMADCTAIVIPLPVLPAIFDF
ncbi:F-box protein At1g67340-like [Curcuma longa]|uniref:F-box protein At1g67340-like n=1 Tax=Curcuma longa TaxID=136217 RepID=UPI003D9F569C